jgi:predicted RNA-binding Zn-ribbon protein involved in translation (DUF1610 family)
VPRWKIRKLYELDALGIRDEDLIDDVGYALLARCQSFLEANMAVRGRAPCPVCGHVIAHDGRRDTTLRCPDCGWARTWGEYFATIQGQQLSGAEPVLELFTCFVRDFFSAPSAGERMYQIDRLLHGFHWHQRYGATRPVAVNLIQGRLKDVIDFLDNLTYGAESTPGLRETRRQWVQDSQYVRSWKQGDARLQDGGQAGGALAEEP